MGLFTEDQMAQGKEFYRVRNFEKHQHYKDRAPVWIKLYTELLDNYEFCALPDVSKSHVILLWLLASRYQNLIPRDHPWIEKKLSATDPIDFPALVNGCFLEICDSASNVLATCYQD